MTDCARGCIRDGAHKPSCPCTRECEDHDNHCDGCAIRLAEVGQLCPGCIHRVTDALCGAEYTDRTKPDDPPEYVPSITQLTHAVFRLEQGKLNAPRKDTDTTRRSNVAHHAPSPAFDTGEEVAQWALRMALICADANHHTGPFKYRPDGIPGLTTDANLRYVQANIAWYASTIPVELYDEVIQAHRGLLNASGTQRLVHRIDAACPTCDRRGMVREDGQERVTCRYCGRIWLRMEEWPWLARTAAS